VLTILAVSRGLLDRNRESEITILGCQELNTLNTIAQCDPSQPTSAHGPVATQMDVRSYVGDRSMSRHAAAIVQTTWMTQGDYDRS